MFVLWRSLPAVQWAISKRNLNGTFFWPVADVYGNANFFCLNRLESILSKRNLASAKLDELKIKLNILKSFVEPAKETISREEAEL